MMAPGCEAEGATVSVGTFTELVDAYLTVGAVGEGGDARKPVEPLARTWT